MPMFNIFYFNFRNKIIVEFPNINEHILYFVNIHREVETWMNTCPRRYISFIQTFSVLLLNKQQSINKRLSYLKVIYIYLNIQHI